MKQRNRLAIILGLVIVMVLTGTGVASALWLTQVTATSTVKVANLDDSCSNVTSVVNASFEAPIIANFNGSPSINQTPDNLVPGWVSRPERIIEIWNANNFMGIAPPVGNQFVELNASEAGTLSQSIATTPGQVLQWSLLHRGRGGVDTMDVLIGPDGGTQVSQGNITDGTAAWVRYSGAYVVPAGQTMTQISFRAVSTGSGDNSIGNFLDDVSFGSGPCLDVSSVVTNVSNPGGPVRAGDQVEYVTTVANTGSSPSYKTVLTNTVPGTLTYTAASMRIGTTTANTTARTDANDTDTAKAAGGVLTAYLGTGATGTAGGSIPQGTQVVFRWLATAPTTSPNNTAVAYTPSVSYVNNLAPLWGETATAPNVPITIYNGSDIRVLSNVTPPASAGASSTWTFALSNIGNAASSAISTTRITAPAGVTWTGVTRNNTSGGTVNVACTLVSTTIYDCAFGSIPAGNTRAINATGLVALGTTAGTNLAVTAVSTSANDYNAANNSATNTAVVADSTAPTTPTNLAISGTTATARTLTWTASTDNVAVTGYRIYRNGTLLTTTSGTGVTYTDSTLSGLTVYNYRVMAVDAAGNASDYSNYVYTLTRPETNANYALTNNRTNGKCLSTANVNGSAVQTANCAITTAAQQWRFVSSGTDTYNVASLNALARTWDVVPGGAGNTNYTDNGRQLRAAEVTDTAQNNWIPRLAADNLSIEFYNPNSGRCLDINGAVTTAGVTLQLYDCNDTPAQMFAATKTN